MDANINVEHLDNRVTKCQSRPEKGKGYPPDMARQSTSSVNTLPECYLQ